MLATTTRTLALAATLTGLSAGLAVAQTLQVGANIGNVPWEFQNEDGDFVGFEVDLVDAVAEQLGRDYEIVNIPFNGLFSAVQSGRIDIAISSITITDERLQSVAFAQPYYDSDQSLTTRPDGPSSLDEMAGKIVGVDTGSTGDIWTQEHTDEYDFGEIRRFEGLNPAMLDLQAGRIDGYISDIPALLYYSKDKPNIEVKQRIETGESYSMMFAQNNMDLARKVNDVITEFKKDGTLADLHEKWFGEPPEAGTSTAEVMDMPETK